MRSILQVVGIARRINKIEELKEQLLDEKGTLYPLQCDVSDKDSLLEAFVWIDETLGPISIMINNAAFVSPNTLTGTKAPSPRLLTSNSITYFRWRYRQLEENA